MEGEEREEREGILKVIKMCCIHMVALHKQCKHYELEKSSFLVKLANTSLPLTQHTYAQKFPQVQ